MKKKLPVVTTEQEVSRCTGHCCRIFALPKPPKVFRRAYFDFVKRGKHSYTEIDFVYPMLIYLGHGRVEYATGHLTKHSKKAETGTHWYTCKNLDRATFNCMVYEKRPQMCREFPYGEPCPYPNCTRKCRNRPVK